jgi:cytochrome o ubiquinol oxidase subunit 2
MSGMSTQLHLMADGNGSYDGSSANLSGAGFSGMRFTAKSSSATDFTKWINSVKHSPESLSPTTYALLARPSSNNQVTYYSSPTVNLYDSIIMKYMGPMNGMTTMTSMPAMSGMQGMATQ